MDKQHCLCRVSLLCFHSSGESQNSQPHSLPHFTLLVPHHSNSPPTFFSFLVSSKDTSLPCLHSFTNMQLCSCSKFKKINYRYHFFNFNLKYLTLRLLIEFALMQLVRLAAFCLSNKQLQEMLCFHASHEAACSQLSFTFSPCFDNLRFAPIICHFYARGHYTLLSLLS